MNRSKGWQLAAGGSIAVLWFAVACATNPATGQRQLSLVSESQEIAIGRSNDTTVVMEMGLTPNEAIQSYVRGMGTKLAQVSERPQLEWSFRVVEDPIVNAFAVPGGFIYITRGIMAYMNSEAQLAAVMGHEIGHVTARHSVEQMSRAQLANLGLGLGMIFSSTVRQVGDVAGAGVGVLFLKFGRDDENQADELGLRYMSKAGFDPREMPGVFTMLQRVSGSEGGGKSPEWLSTHPDPGNRYNHINGLIVAQKLPTGGVVGVESYMMKLNGLMYGLNPREGFFRQNLFLHPDLAFQVQFPAGWKYANQKQAVVAMSAEQDAMIQVEIVAQKSVDEAANAFFGQQGLTASRPTHQRLGDFDGVVGEFAAQTPEGAQIRGVAGFLQYDNRVYQLIGYGTAQGFSKNSRAIESTFGSFTRVTDREVLNMQPMRLEIVKLSQSMNLSQFAQQYPSQIAVDKLALLNQVEDANAPLPAGRLLKRVVRGS